MLVDYSVFENQLKHGLALLRCHLVQPIANLPSPGQDRLHRSLLFSSVRSSGPKVVELVPKDFQLSSDEFALMIKLVLRDLP